MSTSESKKTKKPCKILSQECIGTDIYSMWLDAGEIGKNAVPGQFVSLYSRNGGKLLPRPISLCEIDKAEGKLRLVYRVTGKGTGTEEFSRLHAGVPIETMGPLGKESESRQCWKLLNSWTQKRSWFSDTEMSCF